MSKDETDSTVKNLTGEFLFATMKADWIPRSSFLMICSCGLVI